MPLPDTLDKVRQASLAGLRKHLDTLCAAVDDALFDRSEKAPADEQASYFDAMKEFRLKRQGLVDKTLEGVDRAFMKLAGGRGDEKAVGEFSLDSLTLLGEEELDVSVAFQGMLARTRDATGTLTDHLRQRFNVVLATELEAEKVPLHPDVICEQFKQAFEPLALPLKARLIVYKLFERQMVDAIREVLVEANSLLAQAGVLPDIKVPRIKHSSSSARSSGKDAASESDDDGSTDGGSGKVSLGAAFAELLALARGGMGGGGGGGMPGLGFSGGMPVPAGPPIAWSEMPAGQMPVMYGDKVMVGNQLVQSDVPVQVMAPIELSTLLTQLQRLQQLPQVQAAAPGQGVIIEHEPLESVDVQGGLSELIQDVAAEAPRALAGADKDVIDLVSMLFDYILDDAELPAEMKALIGRLQIPLLKVSLLDKTFFELDDHPARSLVNALARAGIGWTREADDGLYARIESVVHSVLNDFADDVGIFARLEADLTAFLAEREKRMALIESRLRDREEGQAKTVQAQAQVRQVVAAHISGKVLLPEVISVIQDGWQRVLYLTAIRDGIDSETWQQRVKILEVLVWCAVRYEREDLRAKQVGLVPRLLVSLRKGMEAVNYDPVAAEQMLSALRPALEKLGAGTTVRTVRVVAEQAVAGPSDATQTASVQAVQVLRSSDAEVVIAAPPPPPPVPTDVVDERWLQTAESLAPGTWVEFHDDENNFNVRGRIAARIKAQNKFIFVNARGVKIAEKIVDQLAREMQAGKARLISDAALFDRALETMISRLKTGATT